MEKTLLLDRRTYFIGDRVVLSQVLLFLITGLISLLIEVTETRSFFIPLWWLFCIISPVVGIIYLALKTATPLKTESLYFDHHWLAIFYGYVAIWCPPTIYLGILLDSIFSGLYNTFWLSLFLSLIYTSGYLLAKFFRLSRHNVSQNGLLIRGIIICSVIVTVTSVWGGIVFSSAAPGGIDFFEVLSCQMCVIGIYLIITGIGIVIALALHYYMLYCLYDPEGLDVEEDPPNRLYLRIMIVSLILCFISWILMLILFPPVPAGGKGKRRGGGRVHFHHHHVHSRYGTTTDYGKKYPPEDVEKEWEVHQLQK